MLADRYLDEEALEELGQLRAQHQASQNLDYGCHEEVQIALELLLQ